MIGMGFDPTPLANAADIPKLAAIECAMRECEALGYEHILIDDRVSAAILPMLKPKAGVMLHHGFGMNAPDEPRAILALEGAGEAIARPQDHFHPLMVTLDRFMC
jgi:hypothetical protein